MAFTLHGAPLSPFVRKVMYLLTLSKTEYSLKIVAPGLMPDNFVNINPLKKIPVLQENDWHQADSSVICNYLIETLENDALTQLIPATAKSRAHMRWLEKFADYELAKWMSVTVFRQRVIKPTFGKEPNEKRIQEALSQHLPPLLDYLASQLGTQDYVVDNCFSLADIAITSQMVSFMHGGERINNDRWPTLSAYFERMLAQPIWQALVQRELVTLNKLRNSRAPL
tara:strand:+ start:174 stop:851 length:678 start_codon:yes stop_codon:yes gene_type:complete